MEDVIKTATGVFVGGLLALLAHDWLIASIANYQAGQAMNAMQSQMEKRSREEAHRQAEYNRAQREQEAAANAEIQRAREAVEGARLNAIGKENTFQRRYVPPPQCAKDPSTMDCANDYMRAKKAFEAAWER